VSGSGLCRVRDLFGLSAEGATRYLTTIEHPHLKIEGERALDETRDKALRNAALTLSCAP